MSFKGAYQGGPYLELFTTQGHDFMTNWKESNSGIKKKDTAPLRFIVDCVMCCTLCRELISHLSYDDNIIYEKDVKGYVLLLEGSPATTKLTSPKDQKQSLSLIQRFLVLQLFLPKGVDFSLELGVTDMGNNKRRLLLSTAQKETQVTPLHAKVPLTIARRAVWLNLVIDLVSFVGETWISQTFRCLDQISVSANCKLRRVFTMKNQPPDTTDDDELYGCSNTNSSEIDNIPKSCQLTSNVVHQTQVLTLGKIKCSERLKSAKGPCLLDQFRPGSVPDLDLSASGRKSHVLDSKIAFGSKAPRAPETGRKTSQQSSLSNRSFLSQISQNDNNSSSASMTESISSHDENQKGKSQLAILRLKPQANAGTGSDLINLSLNASYSRQQSEPVMQEVSDNVTDGFIERHHVYQQPHPPRQPSSDRVRRRPRIKSLGQNIVHGRGEGNLISPPTSAAINQIGARDGRVQSSVLSSSAAHAGQGQGDAGVVESKRKDLGVGPDVPEIQSPRKDEGQSSTKSPRSTEYDSVADVISLLRVADSKTVDRPYGGDQNGHGVSNRKHSKTAVDQNNQTVSYSRHDRPLSGDENNCNISSDRAGRTEEEAGHDKKLKRDDVEEDSSLSTSASESSHPGEYEESDDETSGEGSKLHFFASPPKSAAVRRNMSPNSGDNTLNQSRKSVLKTFHSDIKRSEMSSNHGARLEDDFVSRSSSDDDPAAMADMMQHQRSMYGPSSAESQHNHIQSNNHSSGYGSGYHASSYMHSVASSPKIFKGHLGGSIAIKSRPASIAPRSSTSPDQAAAFDPRLYSDSINKNQVSVTNPVSRMSKKSLREIDNPFTEAVVHTSDRSSKRYDSTKYKEAEVTDSFEAVMLATLAQEAEDELEDITPSSNVLSIQPQPEQVSHQRLNPTTEVMMMKQLYSESPATTSDDDTSFSTWKAPALSKIPHNYQDEMKSRRSSDTLTSSNPRDWSGVMSPPIGPISGERDLQGTMEGISDFSDEAGTTTPAQGVAVVKAEDEEEKLDLIFDPKLNCYYDPQTKKYYELVL